MTTTRTKTTTDRPFKTYPAWRRACLAINPKVIFTGDKDISTALGIGEWDGAEGIIYATAPPADAVDYGELILVDATGREVTNGTQLKSSRADAEVYTLTGFTAPRHSGSSGRVYVEDVDGNDREFFPTVFDLKIILRSTARHGNESAN